MSREYNLHTNLVEVEKGNRKDLLESLKALSDFDLDFIGENGIEYAWEETLEAGFESNLDYLLDTVKDIKNDEECVNEFVNAWMERDSNYYHDYKVNCLTDENGNIYAIGFSAMAGY